MMAEKDQHTETGNDLFLERKPLKEFKIPEDAKRFLHKIYIHSLYLIQLWMFLFFRKKGSAFYLKIPSAKSGVNMLFHFLPTTYI